MQRSLLLSVSAFLILCVTVVLGLDLLRPSTARADLSGLDVLRSVLPIRASPAFPSVATNCSLEECLLPSMESIAQVPSTPASRAGVSKTAPWTRRV